MHFTQDNQLYMNEIYPSVEFQYKVIYEKLNIVRNINQEHKPVSYVIL